MGDSCQTAAQSCVEIIEAYRADDHQGWQLRMLTESRTGTLWTAIRTAELKLFACKYIFFSLLPQSCSDSLAIGGDSWKTPLQTLQWWAIICMATSLRTSDMILRCLNVNGLLRNSIYQSALTVAVRCCWGGSDGFGWIFYFLFFATQSRAGTLLWSWISVRKKYVTLLSL